MLFRSVSVITYALLTFMEYKYDKTASFKESFDAQDVGTQVMFTCFSILFPIGMCCSGFVLLVHVYWPYIVKRFTIAPFNPIRSIVGRLFAPQPKPEPPPVFTDTRRKLLVCPSCRRSANLTEHSTPTCLNCGAQRVECYEGDKLSYNIEIYDESKVNPLFIDNIRKRLNFKELDIKDFTFTQCLQYNVNDCISVSYEDTKTEQSLTMEFDCITGAERFFELTED